MSTAHSAAEAQIPTSLAATEIQEDFPAPKPLLTVGTLPHNHTIKLPSKCTFYGYTCVLVGTKFSVVRLDDRMLYVLITDSTVVARVMGTSSEQAFLLPPTHTMLQTMDHDWHDLDNQGELYPHSDDLDNLRKRLESLCAQETAYWQDPRLQPRLHDPLVQRYHTYVFLVQKYVKDPWLYVFLEVQCDNDQPCDFRVPVIGRLDQPYMTPSMDVMVMRFHYIEDGTHYKKSVELRTIADMPTHSVVLKCKCKLPRGVLVCESDRV